MKEISIPTADLKCLTFTREMGLAQKHGTVPGSEYDDMPNIPGRGPKHMYEYIQVIVPDYLVEECNLCMNVRRWDLDTIEDYKQRDDLIEHLEDLYEQADEDTPLESRSQGFTDALRGAEELLIKLGRRVKQ